MLLGIFTSFIFPPFFLVPLGFVIFPILFILLTKKDFSLLSYKKHFIAGIFYGFGFFSIYLYWIKEPFLIDDLTKKYSYISYLLIIYCSIYFGIIFSAVKFFKTKEIKFFALPLIIVLGEYFLANFSYGFPWLSFSLVNSANLFGTTLIFFIGSYGLSYLTILFFMLPLIFYEKFLNRNYILIPCLILFILTSIAATIRINKDYNSYYKLLSVSIVQLNFPISTKFQNSKYEKYKEIIKIIKENKSNILIFGENDFPFLMKDKDIKLFQDIIKDKQQIIIGAIRKSKNKYYNSFFLINNKTYQKFDKKILVPFGEFIPFRSIFGFMEFVAGTFDFSKGEDQRSLNLYSNLTLLPVICYEIVYFWKLLNKNNLYSDIIVNLTNDSWFGNFSGPYQHFYFSKLRAAEFNKPLIRVANTGVSALIDNKGKIINYIKLNEKKINNFKFKIMKNNHNFIYLHKLILILFFFLFFMFLIMNRKNAKKI